MCGIVGIWDSLNQVNEYNLNSMRDAVSHRGPDDYGSYIDECNNLGLGHRRLSIVDLSPLGHQPMSNDNETIWVTFNGEVYNFKEIREELITRGSKFKSNTDTEVVVKSYEEWGIDCVHKFIGMFALGIWDKREKILYLLRDRAGIKPLYYYRTEVLLLFASELKSFMANREFRKDIDYHGLSLYLKYGYIPAPHTIFKNTYKVKPGHYLRISNYNKIEEIKYWDIADFYLEDPLDKPEPEIMDELESLLIDSFRYRLVSDVPVGVFLSGGIDSSIVTALLQKSTTARLKTFSIGFYESRFNEAESAKKIANYLGTEHNEYYLSIKEALGIVYKLPEIYDEPMADNSGIPTYLISKLSRNIVKVVLSADGGDELFCGYRRYRHINTMYNVFSRMPQRMKNTIIRTLDFSNPNVIDKIYRLSRFVLPHTENFKDKFSKLKSMLQKSNQGELAEMYKVAVSIWSSEELKRLIDNDYSSKNDSDFDNVFNKLRNNDLISKMMVADFKTYLADDILTKVDRATMSVGLEGRDPFLDHRLIEFVARIPMDLKYKYGESKYILKRVLYRHVPRNLLDRPKQGFNAPLHIWFKKDLSELFQTYLNRDRLKTEGIFDPDEVNIMINDYMKGSSININTLWSLLMFEMWKERWLPS